MVSKVLVVMAVIASILGLIGAVMLASDFSGKVINVEPTHQEKSFEKISLENVQEHNTKQNCWILSENSIYDVTMFIDVYEEGKELEARCGGNAEQEIKKLVPAMREILEDYKIGFLE